MSVGTAMARAERRSTDHPSVRLAGSAVADMEHRGVLPNSCTQVRVHASQHVAHESGMIPGVRVARAAQAYDDEIARGHDRHKLPLVTCGMESRHRKPRVGPCVLTRNLQPEVGAIPLRLIGRCRCEGVVDPSRWKDTSAVPDAVPEVQHPEPGPIARRRAYATTL